MSVYFVTGRLGAGKSLACVGVARDYLLDDRRVATNLDLHLDNMLPLNSRSTAIRLPDKPRIEDLNALGYGCSEKDYTGKRFGALILDELGTWFNSRSWQDKERAKVLDWMLHARKLRWDVYLMVQDLGMVDGQLRDALCEYHMLVRGTQTLAIPVFGQALRILGIRAKLPKGSVATIRYGQDSNGPVLDRKWYRSKDLFRAYETGQVFQSGLEMMGSDFVDMRVMSSMLSAWHLRGRYHARTDWRDLFQYLPVLPVFVVLYLYAALAGRSPASVADGWGITRGTSRRELVKPASVRDAVIFDSDGARGHRRPHVPTFLHVNRHALIKAVDIDRISNAFQSN